MWDRQKQLDRYLNIKQRQERTPYPGEKDACQDKMDELDQKYRFTPHEIESGRAMTENEFYGRDEYGFHRTDPRHLQKILDEEDWDSEYWNSSLWQINIQQSTENHRYTRDCSDRHMIINRSISDGTRRDGSLSQVDLGLKNGYLRAQQWLDENPISFKDIADEHEKNIDRAQRLLKMSAEDVFAKNRIEKKEYLRLNGDYAVPLDFSFEAAAEKEPVRVWSDIPIVNEFYSTYSEYSPESRMKEYGVRPKDWEADEEDIIRDLGLVTAINKSLRRNPALPVSIDDLRRLKKLHARAYGITSLDGLEYAIRLEEINISYNPIKNLSPLGHLHNLKVVNVEGTEVKNLRELASHPMIREINMANTAVEDIEDLVDNRNIKKVDITGCENFDYDSELPRFLKNVKGIGKTKSVEQIRRSFRRFSVL